jgi:hypothetical protein
VWLLIQLAYPAGSSRRKPGYTLTEFQRSGYGDDEWDYAHALSAMPLDAKKRPLR